MVLILEKEKQILYHLNTFFIVGSILFGWNWHVSGYLADFQFFWNQSLARCGGDKNCSCSTLEDQVFFGLYKERQYFILKHTKQRRQRTKKSEVWQTGYKKSSVRKNRKYERYCSKVENSKEGCFVWVCSGLWISFFDLLV